MIYNYITHEHHFYMDDTGMFNLMYIMSTFMIMCNEVYISTSTLMILICVTRWTDTCVGAFCVLAAAFFWTTLQVYRCTLIHINACHTIT